MKKKQIILIRKNTIKRIKLKKNLNKMMILMMKTKMIPI